MFPITLVARVCSESQLVKMPFIHHNAFKSTWIMCNYAGHLSLFPLSLLCYLLQHGSEVHIHWIKRRFGVYLRCGMYIHSSPIFQIIACLVQVFVDFCCQLQPAACAGNRGDRQEALMARFYHQRLHLASLPSNLGKLVLGWLSGPVGGIRRQRGPLGAHMRRAED